ncbi:MAG: 4Fe-4S dicluster domain-containing protein, partial [Syntrophobacter sp.]
MNTLMKAVDISSQFDADFLRNVEEESEQKLSSCYQCGKCTAGCPFSFAYDVPVNQIMRFVQAGQKEAALNCKSIWLCATCK